MEIYRDGVRWREREKGVVRRGTGERGNLKRKIILNTSRCKAFTTFSTRRLVLTPFYRRENLGS